MKIQKRRFFNGLADRFKAILVSLKVVDTKQGLMTKKSASRNERRFLMMLYALMD